MPMAFQMQAKMAMMNPKVQIITCDMKMSCFCEASGLIYTL